MSIPYEFFRVLERKKPSWEDKEDRSPEEHMRFLMKDRNMKGQYLGACLDSCRWGGRTTVMWKTDVMGLMGFIDEWRRQNDDDPKLYHERGIEELYTRFELPHKKNEKCPRNGDHESIIEDRGGRIRCAHRAVKLMRPSFVRGGETGFDELSQMASVRFYEDEPIDPGYENEDGDWIESEPEYSNFRKAVELWGSEEPNAEIVDVCYSIIDDLEFVLPFQSVLERCNLAPRVREVYCRGGKSIDRAPCGRLDDLNSRERWQAEEWGKCPGHYDFNKEVIFPFDGWDVSFLLQRWKEQVPYGNAPWFAPKSENWYRTNNPGRFS